jgi:hypothetical protein
MTIWRAARSAAVLALLLAPSACAERGAGAADPSSGPGIPAAAEGLVLQVGYMGGFVTPAMLVARLPVVSIYADGRVITEGPVPAIYPGPALPNLQVQRIEAGEVQDLVDRALDAGVAESADLGTPPVADALSTRFTVVTAEGTFVREVYALSDSEPPGSGLTPDQEAAREELSDLLGTLTAGFGTESEPYAPESVAAVASPWVDPQDDLPQPDRPWPGPALPGDPTGGPRTVGCVTATGGEAQAVLEAARSANATTAWVTGDGARWSVLFRPLLPHETDCADLRE